MLSLLPGVQYAARVSVADPGHVGKARQAIKRAFEIQLEDKGFSIVEVLSTCPVGWDMTPTEAMDRLRDTVMGAYPVGTFVDRPRRIAPSLPQPGASHRSITEGF
jgi:2-oxoglutarate ferredoxin oxidoreductase subunit beta